MARGNVHPKQIVDHSASAGNVPKFDTDGTLIDSGKLPGGSGGSFNTDWLNITDPTSITFAWRNQGSATETSRTKSLYLKAPNVSGDNIRGREINAPSTPWSITIGIIPHVQNQNFNTVGIYVSDGTKLMNIAVGNGGAGLTLSVNKYNSVTSFSSTPTSPGCSWPQTPVFLKVVDDGTNLKWYWSPNGYDFILLFSEARLTFLASVSKVGYFANSNNSTWPAGVVLISWVQGTS